MRAARISADEQFRLIMECRVSGITDHEWCMQNNIRPVVFITGESVDVDINVNCINYDYHK